MTDGTIHVTSSTIYTVCGKFHCFMRSAQFLGYMRSCCEYANILVWLHAAMHAAIHAGYASYIQYKFKQMFTLSTVRKALQI